MTALGGGMTGGFMPTWMRAVAILQSLGSIFTHLLTLVRFIGSGMVFGGALLGREYGVFGVI
jgi:hypothetical protein